MIPPLPTVSSGAEAQKGISRTASLFSRLRGSGVGARFARGGIGTFGVAAFGTGAAVLLQMLLTRFLGETSFGIYAYTLSIVNLLAMIAVLGFEGASYRFVASYRGLEQWALLRGYVARSLQLSLLLGLAIATLFACYVAFTRRFDGDLRSVMLVAAPMIPFLALLKVASAHVQGLQRVVLGQSVQQLVRPGIFAAAILCFVVAGGVRSSAVSFMALNVAATAITGAVAWFAFRRAVPADMHSATASFATVEWVRVATPLFLISLSQTLLTSTDTLMLGTMLGTTEAGLYVVASQISTAVGFIIAAANAVVAPMIAELYAKGERDSLQRLVVLASRGTLAVATPVFLVLVFAGKPILGLFGPAFTASWAPMVILAFGQLVMVAFGSVGFLLTMTGSERIASTVIILSAVVNVALNALLIPRFGMNGSAAATMISVVLRSSLLSIHVRRTLGFSAGVFGLRHAARVRP